MEKELELYSIDEMVEAWNNGNKTEVVDAILEHADKVNVAWWAVTVSHSLPTTGAVIEFLAIFNTRSEEYLYLIEKAEGP